MGDQLQGRKAGAGEVLCLFFGDVGKEVAVQPAQYDAGDCLSTADVDNPGVQSLLKEFPCCLGRASLVQETLHLINSLPDCHYPGRVCRGGGLRAKRRPRCRGAGLPRSVGDDALEEGDQGIASFARLVMVPRLRRSRTGLGPSPKLNDRRTGGRVVLRVSMVCQVVIYRGGSGGGGAEAGSSPGSSNLSRVAGNDLADSASEAHIAQFSHGASLRGCRPGRHVSSGGRPRGGGGASGGFGVVNFLAALFLDVVPKLQLNSTWRVVGPALEVLAAGRTHMSFETFREFPFVRVIRRTGA